MKHISGLGLENFRTFKDYEYLEFAPITIITGANNSGKSSIFKALLLLKNNISKGLLFQHIRYFRDERNKAAHTHDNPFSKSDANQYVQKVEQLFSCW